MGGARLPCPVMLVAKTTMPAHLFAILTWTTREREPLIDAEGARFLKRFLPATAKRNGAEVKAIGVVQNHVHLVLHLYPIVDVPRLVQSLKGASARVINRDGVMPGKKLRWASGYDLRSISPRSFLQAKRYVENQGRRHPTLAIRDSIDRAADS